MKRNRTGPLLMAAIIGAAWGCSAGAFAQSVPQNVKVTKDLEYGKGGGKSLRLDVYSAAVTAGHVSSPVIVRMAPHRETPTALAGKLMESGFSMIYVGYLPEDDNGASVGSNGPVFSRYPADLQAAQQAMRWLAEHAEANHLDLQRIGLWGSGNGATIAALAGLAPQVATTGNPVQPPLTVRAMCLFEGITDWRNAELYGDESVNIPGSPAYQMFGGNVKEHPDDARMASAVNYIRPTSPATLTVTLASDEQRAMHLIFAETLRKAGVRSALYEEPLSASGAGHVVDEARLNQTVQEFFGDTLGAQAEARKTPTVEQEIDQLAAAGLFKQARRLLEEQMSAGGGTGGGGDAAATLLARGPWLKKLQAINEQQQQPALKQLVEARKNATALALPGGVKTLWTIREVLTDPERIGQYTVEPTIPQRAFEARADALKFVETLNSYLAKNDLAGADRQANVMHDIARKGDADTVILNEFLTRYADIRGKTFQVWPPGIKGVVFASAYGQDLYGYWMDFKAGGQTQRLRYIPPGSFAMGSSHDEWGRLPDEPLLEPTAIGKGFWLGDTEVTQATWEGVLGPDENHSAFKKTGEVRLKLPAENLSYAHAVNFLNKLGVDARLPTEAEWEYACRAGSTYMYSGTGRLADMGWFWDEARPGGGNPAAPIVDGSGDIDINILHELETDRTDMARLTHPVKQKLPNKWGLYDMQGNVWEWCSGTSPLKPRDFHPAKGGSWLSIPQSCRAARDVWFSVEQQSWNLGMRICIPAQ